MSDLIEYAKSRLPENFHNSVQEFFKRVSISDVKLKMSIISLLDTIDSDDLGRLLSRDGAIAFSQNIDAYLHKIGDSFLYYTIHEWMKFFNLFYKSTNRYFECIYLMKSIYNKMVERSDIFPHHGAPLVWARDCYKYLDYRAIASRYMALTLIEDAIRDKGQLKVDETGVFFRMAWDDGISKKDIEIFMQDAYEIHKRNDDFFKEKPDHLKALNYYPEYILLDMKKEWLQILPSTKEHLYYDINRKFAFHLLTAAEEDDTGIYFEKLAQYLFLCIPGCRSYRRKRSKSGTDYDVLALLEGHDIDFRSDIGRFIICQCKDWNKPVGISEISSFIHYLNQNGNRLGILFSKHGVTGEGSIEEKYARRELLRSYYRTGTIALVITYDDLDQIIGGSNFISLIRERYTDARLDLQTDSDL